MYNILFYEDENGNKPVEDFIDEFDAAALYNKNAREIILFFYITSLKQRKRHLQRKLRLLKDEWTVGY